MKKIIAVVAVFILTATAIVLGSPGARAQGMPTNYPYVYGTPTVQTRVGAQGVQGPVPGSWAGPTTPYAQLGAKGHLGPVNLTTPWIWPTGKTNVAFTVLNGTPGSHTNANQATVSLTNVTYGTKTTGLTGAAGTVTISVVPGWYLTTVGGRAFTNLNYTQLLYLNPGNPSWTVYLIPATNANTAVSNGGATHATLYLTQTEPWGQSLMEPQREFQLVNVSGGNAVISTTYSLDNGTAVFTLVNPAFTYKFNFLGYSSAVTNLLYYESNVTSNSFTVVAGANHIADTNFESGHSFTTGVLTGSSIPAYQSNANWNINSATTIVGGATYVSMGMNFASTLKIINGIFFINTSRGYQGGAPAITFTNSTVVILTQAQQAICPTGAGCLTFKNSVFIDQLRASPGYFQGVELATKNATSSVFSTLDEQNFGYTHGSFYNSLFTRSPNVNLGDNAVPARSTYINWTTAGNSSIVGGPVASGTNMLSMVGDVSNNTSFDPSTISLTLANSWLEIVPPGTNAYGFPTTWGNLSHVRLQLAPEFNVSFTTVYNSYSVLQTGKGQSVPFYLPSHVNLSCVYLNQSYPNINLTVEQPTSPTSFMAFDIVLNVNYTITQMTPLPTNRIAKAGILLININTDARKFINYSILNLATLGQFDIRNTTFVHDIFPYLVWVNPFEPFQFSYPTHGKSWDSFYNTTFGTYYFDETTLFPVVNFEYGAAGSNYIQNTNFPLPKLAWFNLTYCTFQARMMGGGQAQASADIFAGENQVYTTVLNSKFDNSFAHTIGASRTLAQPYNYDLMVSGGTANLTRNVFMNLTNQTMPIGSNAGLSATTEGKSMLTLTSNQYFYAPMPGQSFIPSTGVFQVKQGPATPTDTFTGRQLVSTIAYEIAMTPNGTITLGTQGQLQFNASILQTDPVSGDLTAHAYAWGIAPDVNVSSTTAGVGFFYGLAGGSQPNFFWHGYNYSERVESDHVNLAVNSTAAPTVNVVLSALAPSSPYILTKYNTLTGAVVSSVRVNSMANGTITTTFAPATNTINETIAVSPDLTIPLLLGAGLGVILIAAVLTGVGGASATGAIYIGRRRRRRRQERSRAIRRSRRGLGRLTPITMTTPQPGEGRGIPRRTDAPGSGVTTIWHTSTTDWFSR